MARRLIIDDRTGVLYEDFTGRRIASLGELLNAEAGATETIEVFSVAVNPQTRAVTANTILTANVSLDLGVPRAKPTGGKLTVTYGSDTSGEIPIETLTAETLSSALNRLDAMETAGGCDVWRAAEDDSELSFYVRLHNNGAPGTNPSFDCDGATPPAIGEVTVVKAGASSERALWLVNIAEKPVASIAESAWSTVTSGSFGGLTASLALNGAGLIAHLSKETPGELTLTVKNSSSVLYRGTVDALSSVDPTDLNGSAILSIFPRIVTSTSNPAVTDDSGDGYAAGTLWINTTSDTYFVLADAAEGAAVWVSSLPLAGGTMTGAIAMGSNKITGLADGTASGDAINKGQLDGLIDDAPDALNTLNELAAALGDDVNFSTTVATNIATKLPIAGGTMTGALNTLDINLTDSDVAHGITNVAATDAYGHLSTIHGTQGGLYINGISDQESADARSLALRGICNDTHTDTVPTVEIIGAKRSGTTVQALADAETVLTVANHTSTLLTVLGSGNTGIGTVSPTAKLEVVGGDVMTDDSSGIRFGGSSHRVGRSGNDLQINASNAGNGEIAFLTGDGTEKARIDSSGNVGINTTAASSLLDVRGDAGAPGILTLSTAELTVRDNDVLGKISFGAPLEETTGDSRLDGAAIWAEANATFSATVNSTDLVFATGASEVAAEKMRLTSAGDLIISENGIIGQSAAPSVTERAYIKFTAWSCNLKYAAASAFYFDANTQINLNGVDRNCTFHTAAGNDKLWIDGGTGFVGVNTNVPTSSLDVRGDAGYPGILTLSTAETSVIASNQLGRIDFVAPLESSGTDAILVGASITALAVSEFTSISNTTDLVFSTAISETATEKMRLTSAGDLKLTGTTCKFYPHASVYFGESGNHGIISVGSTGYGLSVYGAGGHLNINASDGAGLGWSSGHSDNYNTPDIVLARDAASILGLRVNGAAQELRIYSDLGDPAGNYERGSFAMDTSGDLTIATEKGGDGADGDIILSAAGTLEFHAVGGAAMNFYTVTNHRGTFDNGRWMATAYGTSDLTSFCSKDDTNSGLALWNTDRISLMTGGAHALFIDASQNVGIGDTDPGTLLQLSATAPYVTLKNSTAENTAGGCESKIIFEDHGDNALGQIEVSHVGTSDDEKGQLVISTNNDSGLQAALTIDEAQKVTFEGTVQLKVYTVGALPSGSPAGQRAFVSDSYYGFSYAYLGTVVSGAGSNFVPVYSDGTYWKIG